MLTELKEPDQGGTKVLVIREVIGFVDFKGRWYF